MRPEKELAPPCPAQLRPVRMAVEHSASAPLLVSEKLTLRYGQTVALREISLPIAAGEITALVGPSGCGKTSFLMALNRLSDLIPHCRVQGRIRFGELDLLNPRTDLVALRRRIGMIFQRPNPFPLSIHSNLAMPLREHGVRTRSEINNRVKTALREVGLWQEVETRLEHPAVRLSGGQQQRLCIARALVLGPELLLMDEPCSALDPQASYVVEELITRLRERLTILIVTHNLAQARRVADSAALFWLRDGAGELIEHAPTRCFFDAPSHPLTAAYVAGRRG